MVFFLNSILCYIRTGLMFTSRAFFFLYLQKSIVKLWFVMWKRAKKMWRKISNVNFTHRFYVKLEQISHTANIIGSNFRSLVWRVDKQNKHIDTTCHVTKEIKWRKSHQKKQRWKTFPLHITGHAKSPNTKNRNTNRDIETESAEQ